MSGSGEEIEVGGPRPEPLVRGQRPVRLGGGHLVQLREVKHALLFGLRQRLETSDLGTAEAEAVKHFVVLGEESGTFDGAEMSEHALMDGAGRGD